MGAVFPATTNAVINTAAIAGVTAPVTGATPVTSVSGTGYTGIVTWSGSPTTFAAATAYTATVTLTAASGYTLTGVAANFFTVSGATTTNAINTGVVGAVFPATTNDLPAGYITTQQASGGVAAAVAPAGQVAVLNGWTLNGGGTLTWAPVTTSTLNFSNAAAQCAAIGIGWRMATIGELSGLMNTSSAFSAVVAAGLMNGIIGIWSSSVYDVTTVPSVRYYWQSQIGAVGVNNIINLHGVSCVK